MLTIQFFLPLPLKHYTMINICVNIAKKHGSIYNERKNKFLCIKPVVLKNINVLNVELNGEILELVTR